MEIARIAILTSSNQKMTRRNVFNQYVSRGNGFSLMVSAKPAKTMKSPLMIQKSVMYRAALPEIDFCLKAPARNAPSIQFSLQTANTATDQHAAPDSEYLKMEPVKHVKIISSQLETNSVVLSQLVLLELSS